AGLAALRAEQSKAVQHRESSLSVAIQNRTSTPLRIPKMQLGKELGLDYSLACRHPRLVFARQSKSWMPAPGPRPPASALGDSHISKCPVKSMGCRHGPKHILTAPLVRWVEGVQAETCIFPMLANSCSGPDITCAHTLGAPPGHASPA